MLAAREPNRCRRDCGLGSMELPLTTKAEGLEDSRPGQRGRTRTTASTCRPLRSGGSKGQRRQPEHSGGAMAAHSSATSPSESCSSRVAVGRGEALKRRLRRGVGLEARRGLSSGVPLPERLGVPRPERPADAAPPERWPPTQTGSRRGLGRCIATGAASAAGAASATI